MKRPLFYIAIAFVMGLMLYMLDYDRALKVIIGVGIIYMMILYLSKNKIVKNYLKKFWDVSGIGNVPKLFLLLFVAFVMGFILITIRNYSVDKNIMDAAEGRQKITLDIRVDKVMETEDGANIYGKYNSTGIIIKSEETDIYKGQIIRVTGILVNIETDKNPGAFDIEKYYRGLGIEVRLLPEKVEIISDSKDLFSYAMRKVKKLFSKSLDLFIAGDEAGILKGMLIGEKSDINPEIKSLYQKTGIAHILAISALHVGMIGKFIIELLRKLGLKRKPSACISIFLIMCYGIMTGFAIPTLRAIILIILGYIADFRGRVSDMPNSLGIAAVIMVIIEPDSIFSTGFAMSFAAAIGVFMGGEIVRRSIKGIYRKTEVIKKAAVESLVVSFSINVIMLPVIIYNYYEFPLYSMLINFIVIPLLTLAVISGFVTALIGFIFIAICPAGLNSSAVFNLSELSPFRQFIYLAGKTAIIPAEYILKFYEMLCRVFMKLPFASVNVGYAPALVIVIYYLVVGLLYYKFVVNNRRTMHKLKQSRKKIYAELFIALVPILMALVLFLTGTWYLNIRRERAVFLSVGQGDCAIVHIKNGPDIMVDCGSTSRAEPMNYVTIPALKYYGMSELDYIFISHMDLDHVGGIIELLSNYEMNQISVKYIVIAAGTEENENSEIIRTLAKRNNIEIISFAAGDMIQGKGFNIKAVYPAYDTEADIQGNERSLVLLFDLKTMQILFTGDISMETEHMLSERLEDEMNSFNETGKLRILKIPHHGSKYSSSEEMLAIFNGDIAVISVGRNSYGHPTKEAMDKITEAGYTIIRTDEDGAYIYME